MGLCRWGGRGFLWLLLPLLAWLLLSIVDGGSDAVAVVFVKVPPLFSPSPSAAFRFRVGGDASLCSNCSLSCKLDNYTYSDCTSRKVSYKGLHDGSHSVEVCIRGYRGVPCASYNWTVDTVSPTAYVSVAMAFTNASNVSVHITFTEPCPGGGGFRCSSNECNLLVYGSGHAIPSSLTTLQPGLEFSLLVAISSEIQYGRLVLVMDRSFCTDTAGNRFRRTSNSSFFLHFDRRNVFLNLTTHIPEKQLQLNGDIRTVEATNEYQNLKIYLYFSEPVLNSSAQILGVLHTTNGVIIPTNRRNLGSRRFGYVVNNISSMSVITVTCETSSIISRQGTPVSPSDPVTFLYDTQRPSVRLSTPSKMRTRENNISVSIKFVKPVFNFNSSALLIYGGHLLSFHEVSMSIYVVRIHADEGTMYVEVPQNAAMDIAGNRNLASNRLQVRHYSVPMISSVVSTTTTIIFLATSIASALLSISTESLLSSGAFSRPTTHLISEPSRNLLRIACHIQIFALSKWLAVSLPIEYFEFVRGIEWSIPYLSLPWENVDGDTSIKDSRSPVQTYSEESRWSKLTSQLVPMSNKELKLGGSIHDKPLTAIEYRWFLENQDLKPEAEFVVNPLTLNRWTYFGRNMFWLAVIGGGLMVLRAIILFILKLRKKDPQQKNYFGPLIFPRFEIFLIFLAVPCICQASATIVKGGDTAGILVGVVLLGLSCFLLLFLFLFLSCGITMSKLLSYKEVHQEGQEFHWYHEIIRVFLGPGKIGQWTWKDRPNSVYLTKFGPVFEDLRGPPKYMLSQISGSGNHEIHRDKIIHSDDETEDAEAPFIQRLFGILRIYYTLLDSLKRVSLGLVAGIYSTSGYTKVPTLVLLSITSFQLFFLVLKKPFIKKKVQLVEIISVTSEVGIFASCLVLYEKNFSDSDEMRIGFFMLALFVVGFTAQMINEWYALYRQVVRLSPNQDSFFSGVKTITVGLLLVVLPGNLLSNFDERFTSDRRDGDVRTTVTPGDQFRSSGTSEKPWVRQLRELAKASFSKENRGAPSDPSSSRNRTSGFWSGKRSGSSSITSSFDSKAKVDFKAKSKGLHRDLETIFSSK